MLETVRFGDKKEIIKVLKLCLVPCADFQNVSDEYDEEFKTIVGEFQSNNGLVVDYIFGEKSYEALLKILPTVSTTKNKISSYAAAVQIICGCELVDGVFGPKTKTAVKTKQTELGLTADGIWGPKSWSTYIFGKTEPAPSKGEYKSTVDYKQYDSKWAKKVYSNHGDTSQTMKSSGCGPTAMANIVATLIDPSVTPWDLAQLSMKWGCRTANSGTALSFFAKIENEFHFSKRVYTTSIAQLKKCLDEGGYVVCRMGPGYWTKGGHYITAWKYDDKYIYCNDPASSTRKKQEISAFVKERKDYECFWK